MAQKTASLLPATENRLRQFGDRLRLARLRRSLTAKQVAERAGMTAVTLRNLERGGSGVTIGAYLAVMQVLGIEQDLDLIAKDDPQGRVLQDARLPRRISVPVSAKPQPAGSFKPARTPAVSDPHSKSDLSDSDDDWIAGSDFVNANTLVELITPPRAPSPRKRR